MRTWFKALPILLVTLGCGQTQHPVVPVSGKISFTDGTPLPAGTVLRFDPASGGTVNAIGVVKGDGSLDITHPNGQSGAEVGPYVVVLQAPEGGDSLYQQIPREYYDGGALSVTIKPDMAPLDLKVKKLKSKKG